MTKADIVDTIAESTGLTKVETETVVEGFLETVKEAMKQGKRIEIRGFGTFRVVKRAERLARNPRTNEEVTVPERFEPELKISRKFMNQVNEARQQAFQDD